MFNLISADGYFEGVNHDISWHNVDEELNTADLILFGRVTYNFMATYWPTSEAIKDDPIIANIMNKIPKIVFSKTLQKVEWENTRLVTNAEEEVLRLKKEDGKNIYIFGSSDLTVSLAKADLIDEYRIMLNPIFLGGGKTILQGINKKIKLNHISSRTFNNGNVLLTYNVGK